MVNMKKKNILFIKGNEVHVTLKVQLPGLRRFCLRNMCEMRMCAMCCGIVIVNISLVKKCCS
jgi:hypothetical protein